ncbi:MAG: hypothetical protein SFY81_02855 [Verrucomicrobiota bacterium]|nr:hypothetical protein [Verrucomicrobiota bacterium]
MNEFEKYKELKVAGKTPAEVFQIARKDGVDEIKMIRLLRQVFNLSLTEAKEVIVNGKTGGSLSAHQQSLAKPVEQALDHKEERSGN